MTIKRLTDSLNAKEDLSQKDIEAVDIEISGQDNRLFLDYVRILKSDTKYSKVAQDLLSSYFHQYSLVLQLSGKEKEEKLSELFEHIRQEDEFIGANRLGLSEIIHGVKPTGKGPGETIEKALSRVETTELVKDGVITNFSQVHLFVKGINKDKISDFLTGILKEVLTDFTADFLSNYPSHQFEVAEVEEYVWSLAENKWILKTLNAYYYKDERIVLVPKYWVSRNYDYTVRRLFNNIILESQLVKDAFLKYIQENQIDKNFEELQIQEAKEIFKKVYGKPTKEVLLYVISSLKERKEIKDINLTQYKLPELDDEKLDFYILEPYLTK